MGFPSKPLPVYSGGGGVHYWCHVPYEWADTLSDFTMRQQVLLGVVLTDCPVKFDENVTTIKNHLIRMPFSLHDHTGRVALPLDVAALENMPAAVDDFSAAVTRLKNWLACRSK
jgi:DNA primase catalytic subunit